MEARFARWRRLAIGCIAGRHLVARRTCRLRSSARRSNTTANTCVAPAFPIVTTLRRGRVAGGVISIRQTTCVLPFYRPVPLTTLPLIYHREHLFPYASYGGTELTPLARTFRLVVLENDALRIEVAPESADACLVCSISDGVRRSSSATRSSGPVRILPIWAFISGGIEFNFPIAHSPTSITEVGCVTGQIGDYGFVRVGEREGRTGMEWVVELGLCEDQPFLVQRTALRNPTRTGHPWMSWTIAAIRSTTGTEFVHPPHRVLVHDDRVIERDWPGPDLAWDRGYRQMTALFWKPGSAPHFGAFHHDLGFGLMHLADPAQLPGKKVWTYGHGVHRAWGQATTWGDQSYCEARKRPADRSEREAPLPRRCRATIRGVLDAGSLPRPV